MYLNRGPNRRGRPLLNLALLMRLTPNPDRGSDDRGAPRHLIQNLAIIRLNAREYRSTGVVLKIGRIPSGDQVDRTRIVRDAKFIPVEARPPAEYYRAIPARTYVWGRLRFGLLRSLWRRLLRVHGGFVRPFCWFTFCVGLGLPAWRRFRCP